MPSQLIDTNILLPIQSTTVVAGVPAPGFPTPYFIITISLGSTYNYMRYRGRAVTPSPNTVCCPFIAFHWCFDITLIPCDRSPTSCRRTAVCSVWIVVPYDRCLSFTPPYLIKSPTTHSLSTRNRSKL